jgi:hypothetical protein
MSDSLHLALLPVTALTSVLLLVAAAGPSKSYFLQHLVWVSTTLRMGFSRSKEYPFVALKHSMSLLRAASWEI